MIQSVDNSSGTQAAKAPKSPASSAATSFASALKAAGKTSAASGAAPASVVAASDEEWTPVAGVTSYAKITAGPRTGQYVDLNKGKHHGDAFTIEQRAGRTVHVFKGADGSEQVVSPTKEPKLKKAHGATDSPGKNETWGPVKGHSGYADILSGGRNGMFVNTSGGPRSGQAFQLVRRGNDELHIYGEGKNRIVVAVPLRAEDGTKTTGKAAPKASGGATAPTTK
jgi:hypothetical protein